MAQVSSHFISVFGIFVQFCFVFGSSYPKHVCNGMNFLFRHLHEFGWWLQTSRHFQIKHNTVCAASYQAILARKDDFVPFPNTAETIQVMKQDFMTYSRLPNVISL